MQILGKIISVEARTNTGTLITDNGIEFFFFGRDSIDGIAPDVGTIVTFERDTHFRRTLVAQMIEPLDWFDKFTA